MKKKFLTFLAIVAGASLAFNTEAGESVNHNLCDAIPGEASDFASCEMASAALADASSCEAIGSRYLRNTNYVCDYRYRTPAMIGDFFGGSPIGFRGDSILDRLMVVADDLDSPSSLPPSGSTLSISEAGPVGIFSTSITSVSQLQTLLRAGSPIPGATVEGTINDSATLTTSQTIGQIQSLLSSTALPYDIIGIQPPPGSYTAGVNATFATRNAIPGTTAYSAAASGAFLQGGADSLTGGEDLDAFYFYNYVVRFNTALADASSGGIGRLKIAEGGSVLPTNRVFFRYSNIHNVAFTNSGRSLNRFVPGFERTLYNGLMSIELRAPFATDATTTSTLDSNSFSNGNDTRFGNLTLYLKALLYQSERLAITGGTGLALPTASDIRVNYANGASLLNIQNESTHIQPFLGMLYTPNSRFYAQGFLQYDVTASGNSVAINSTGSGLQRAGVLTDPNHLFIDAGAGYWLYRSNACSGLTGIIPTVEVHQTSSTQDGDIVSAGPFQVGNFSGSTSITSLVAGTTFEFGRRSQLTAGYATPIGGGADQQYDGAFQFFYNRLLGN
ncbi:MAG: hypothetical protein SGI77_21530 [Pirellulaceae bacterium]|nr:hypothetical protein [Pirellulaceae bacterium]